MAVFNEPTQWDHELGNNADVSTLPDDTSATTGLASLQKLFQIINQTPLQAGGVAPNREDINALFKVLGDSVYYGMNGGLASYNPAYDYAVGRFVVYNNTLYKCIQANGASSTVVAPDSVSPLGSDYWKDIENQDSTSLIPNQIIQSPVPLTDANLHLLDGALLSGSGAYADYVTMMGELYNADPTATCWTDEATWQASVTTYGECGKFVYDSVNNTLRLPKLTSFVQATSTASELGLLVEAGAPNIKSDGLIGVGASSNASNSSALYVSGSTSNGYNSGPYLDAGLYFDASRSNSIYGNSNTIQPQAIKYYFYIVLGTVSKTQIQIDIDNVMADLALKADKDFSNVSAPVQTFKDMSIEWGIPDYSSGISLSLTGGAWASWTAPSDGFICMVCDQSSSIVLRKYNSTGAILSYLTTTSAQATSNIVPVSKGTILAYNTTVSGVLTAVNFYPCKGAN